MKIEIEKALNILKNKDIDSLVSYIDSELDFKVWVAMGNYFKNPEDKYDNNLKFDIEEDNYTDFIVNKLIKINK
jgi:hypothetical protein